MFFFSEKQEKIKALLKNAEISQSEERLKQELRNECHESSELFESTQSLQESLRSKDAKLKQLNDHIAHIDQQLQQQRLHVDRADDLQREIHEKNKVNRTILNSLHFCSQSQLAIAILCNSFADDQSIKWTTERYEEDATARDESEQREQWIDKFNRYVGIAISHSCFV